jgi:rod shape-determining protein MreB
VLGKKLGIDLGSATTRVITRGDGVLFSEPTVVACRDGDPATGLVGAAAIDAASTDRSLRLRHPVRGGDVTDRMSLDVLIQQTVNRAVGRQRIFKPDMVLSVRAGMSGADRLAVLDAAVRSGARTVYLIDAAIAAAMGAGVSITSPRAHLVIDIGAGKTDVAVLALEGTVACRSLAVGVDDLLTRVAAHVEARHGVALGPSELQSATHLLVAAPHEERTAELGGVLLSSHELGDLVNDHLRTLDEAILGVIDETPSALRHDLRGNGVVLTGGGARQEGLGRRITTLTGYAARVVAEPEGCAVRGTAMAVDNLDVLKRSFLYMR